MRLFRDRDDAGRQLGEALAERGYRDGVVLGIPRGGVIIAARVAERLGAQPGVVVARKLRAPARPEFAIGAVTADGTVYLDPESVAIASPSPAYIREEIERQVADARGREARFAEAARPALAGRTVIVVDDGLATGATAIAALRSVRAAGAARTVLAVPVGPPAGLAAMRDEADEVVCPHPEEEFFAVGQFYARFGAVNDEEVGAVVSGWRSSPNGK